MDEEMTLSVSEREDLRLGEGDDGSALKSGETQAESATLLLAFLPAFGWVVPMFSLGSGADMSGTYLGLFPSNSTSWLVLIFMFMHHLRMALGFAFISQDDSFQKAIREAYGSSDLVGLSRSEVVIRFTMTFLLGASLVLFKYQVILLLHAVVFFQLFIMATYHRIFWWALYDLDSDRWKNCFIIAGDTCFLILFFCGVTCDLGLWSNNTEFLSNLVMITFSIFSFVFSLELVLQYIKAAWNQIRELGRGYSILHQRISNPEPSNL